MIAPNPSPDFVGRTAELALFERAFTVARAGVPSIVLVGGEAGIGKSTLISEAVARAGAALYLGRCVPMGGEVIPLAPLAGLLRQIRQAIPDVLDKSEHLAPLARWLNPVTPPVTDVERGAGGLFVPVLDVVGQLAAEDVVAVGIEDLHWADAVTWELFDFLARNLVAERVLLIGAYRTNEVGSDSRQRRRLGELARLPQVQRILLAGLDREDVAARISTLLGSAPSGELVESILARGQGNPFFTQELVAAHAAGEAIPTVLSDLIAADIAELDEPARHVLAAMSVAGRDTTHTMLGAITDLGEDGLEAALRSAIDTQLVVVEAVSDAYRFRHALIGEVVYADLLPPQRARLHRRVAEALRSQHAGSLTRADRAGALAFHLDRGGDREGAFAALLAAADAAETLAPAAAFGHLERAFELWDAAAASACGESRAARLWQAAELASATAGSPRAVELARAALAEGPPSQGEAWARERLGRYLWSAGRIEESRVEFANAAALLGDEAPAAAAPVFAGLAQAELMAGRYEVAEQWCHRVFDLVDGPGSDPLAWGRARRVLGVTRGQLGHPDEGVDLCAEAVAAAGTAQGRVMALIYLCLALLDAGRSQEAVDTALAEIAEGQLAGVDYSFGGYLDALAADGLMRLGRWAEAEAILTRHTIDDALPVGAMRTATAGALLAARRGDGARAQALLTDAGAYPIDGWHQTFFDLAEAQVHLALGNWAAASAAAERGWERCPRAAVLRRARFAMASAEAAVELALDALASHQAVDVEAIVAYHAQLFAGIRAQAEAASAKALPLDTAAHLAQGTAALSRLSAANPDVWSAAVRRWEALGDRWWVAVATLREADAAASSGDTARAADALRSAHRLATELGARGLVAEAAAISRRTRISVEAPTQVRLDDTSLARLGLTAREAEVLLLVAVGHTNRQIGEQLFVSEKTVSVHVSAILRKLGVTSRVDAAAIAQRLGVA